MRLPLSHHYRSCQRNFLKDFPCFSWEYWYAWQCNGFFSQGQKQINFQQSIYKWVPFPFFSHFLAKGERCTKSFSFWRFTHSTAIKSSVSGFEYLINFFNSFLNYLLFSDLAFQRMSTKLRLFSVYYKFIVFIDSQILRDSHWLIESYLHSLLIRLTSQFIHT